MLVRPATPEDANILFEWRNDPLTREMSKNGEPVEWDSHVKWLESRLARPRPDLYIAEIDGTPVGTIRIDDGELSYTTAPHMRGRGVATQMLMWAFGQFGQLTAEIKPENKSSIAAATRAGHRVVLLAGS